MTDTDKSRELFNALRREGECYHTWQSHGYQYHMTCLECHKSRNDKGSKYGEVINPDFFSPPSEEQGWIWFGWMWERVEQAQWRGLFYTWLWDKFTHSGIIFLEGNIGCTAFADALYSYFESQNG